MSKNSIADGLMNVVSGLGTSKDKNEWSSYQRRQEPYRLAYNELEAMYTESWIAQKIIRVVPEDMTRAWRKLTDDSLPPSDIRKYEREERRLRLSAKCAEALTWARLYGGALLVPILKSTQKLSEPLRLDTIKQGDLLSFNVVDARFAYPSTHLIYDPTNPKYLLPEYYTLAGTVSTRVHHSRVIRFEGNPLPRFEKVRNRFWGQTVLESVRKAIINAETMSGCVASLMHELNLDVLSVEGLSNALAAGQEDVVMRRFETYQTLKSIYNLVVVDSNEQFNNRTVPFSGIENLVEQFYTIVSGATDIPYTRLVGTSPKGLNATGEGDLRNYYDMINSKQICQLSDCVREADGIIHRSLFGKPPSEDFDFNWVPLWQEEPEQKAKREKTQAERDQLYLDMGVIDESIIIKELKQQGTYDNITQEYVDEVENAVREAGNPIERKEESAGQETKEDPSNKRGQDKTPPQG